MNYGIGNGIERGPVLCANETDGERDLLNITTTRHTRFVVTALDLTSTGG